MEHSCEYARLDTVVRAVSEDAFPKHPAIRQPFNDFASSEHSTLLVLILPIPQKASEAIA